MITIEKYIYKFKFSNITRILTVVCKEQNISFSIKLDNNNNHFCDNKSFMLFSDDYVPIYHYESQIPPDYLVRAMYKFFTDIYPKTEDRRVKDIFANIIIYPPSHEFQNLRIIMHSKKMYNTIFVHHTGANKLDIIKSLRSSFPKLSLADGKAIADSICNDRVNIVDIIDKYDAFNCGTLLYTINAFKSLGATIYETR